MTLRDGVFSIHLSLKLGAGGLTLGFYGATALFLGAIGFGFSLTQRFSIETIHLLFGFGDHGLSGLPSTLQLFSQIGLELFNLSQLLLGISTTGGDKALSLFHDLADRTEEESI